MQLPSITKNNDLGNFGGREVSYYIEIKQRKLLRAAWTRWRIGSYENTEYSEALKITQCWKVIYKKASENIKIRKGIFKEICGKHSWYLVVYARVDAVDNINSDAMKLKAKARRSACRYGKLESIKEKAIVLLSVNCELRQKAAGRTW